MTNYEFKQAIRTSLFIQLRPSDEELKRLAERYSKGEIVNPAITCRALTNYRRIKTAEENIKLQNIVAHCYLLGLSHEDITPNANVVWDLVDDKQI